MLGILRRIAGRRHAHLNERVQAADALEEDGRWSEARGVYSRALAREPENTAALRRLASLAQREGEVDEALGLWRRLAELRPERPDACLQAARLSLRRGVHQDALAFAERAARLAPPGRPHEIAHRARSLRDHLIRGEKDLGARHLAIGGMSFCGSTLLGFLLGSLPDVTNVGESHSLVYRQRGEWSAPVDYSKDDPEEQVLCNHCGAEPCPVWTLPFRRALSADPIDWYGKLAAQAGTAFLVSSDKGHAKLTGLDPLGRHDLIVLFKSPSTAFASARRRPRPPKQPERYLARWEREYQRLLHDLPVTGRRVVLHFDAFRRNPDAHLRRLAKLLDLPIPVGRDLLTIDPNQHVVGGNSFMHQDLQDRGKDLSITPRDTHDLPTAESDLIAERVARSPIARELHNLHAEAFGTC